MSRLALALFMLLSTGASAVAGESVRSPQRWAVLASPPVEKTGLPDLLTVDLSARKNIELVERARIRDVTRELALSQVLGPATSRRLKLGRLLKADRLAILVKGRTAKPSIHLVICDCRTGARLWHGVFPSEDVTAVRAAIRDRIGRVAAQHSTGKLRVIGLSPFKSNNLVHDYDHLQASFAHLLASALLAVPNVAVVETEEASAISKELTDGVQRTVPLFVKGSFEVANAVTKKDVTFTVEVLLTRGPRKLATLRREKVPLREVARFLRREVAPRVLEGSGKQAGQPLAEAEQVTELVTRADAFTRVGDWEHAIGLREAALLIEPRNTDQRLQVMFDYRWLMRSRLTEAGRDRWKKGNTKTAPAIRKRVRACVLGFGHLEYLIRNGRIDIDQATKLTAQHRARNLIRPIPYMSNEKGHRIGAEILEVAERVEDEFMVDVYPRALRLKRPPEPKHRYVDFMWMDRWGEVLVESALTRVDRHYPTASDLKHLKRVLTEVTPDRLSVSHSLVQFLEWGPWQLKQAAGQGMSDVATPKDWRAFLAALEASDHQVARTCGRYGLLYWPWRASRGQDWGDGAGVVPSPGEVAKLLKDFEQLPYAAPWNSQRTKEPLYDRIKALHRRLQPRPAAVHSSPPPARQPKNQATGRMAFKPLDLQVRLLDGKTVPLAGKRWETYGGSGGLRHLLQCGDTLDVMWNAGVVLFMRAPGVLEEVVVDKQPIFTDVKYDGQRVWIATRRAGLWVLDRNGKIEAKVGTQQGLPPADRSMMVHPIAPGKVCAVGSFGKHKRAWCAIVEPHPKGHKVNVFHRAVKIPRTSSVSTPSNDPELVFEPHWLHALHTVKGREPHLLLVGRDGTTLDSRMQPLQINLTSLKVSTLKVPPYPDSFAHADMRREFSYFSRRGALLEASDFGVRQRAALGTTWGNGKTWRLLLKLEIGQGYFREHLLFRDGYVYAPGSAWFKIDPATWKVEELTAGRLPGKYEFNRYAVSAHYGFVGWGSRQALHQISVLPKPEPKPDQSRSRQ